MSTSSEVDRSVIHAVGLALFSNARLLLVRSARQRSFYLPGGKIDPGETELSALHREVHEELGVRLCQPRPLGNYRAPAVGQGADVVVELSCYAGSLDGPPAASAEIAELSWMTRRQYLATTEPAPAVVAMWAEHGPE